jgi:hypothetical protein
MTELTCNELDIVNSMLSFCEEHWVAFVLRMKERGMEEHEVDELFNTLWEKVNE